LLVVAFSASGGGGRSHLLGFNEQIFGVGLPWHPRPRMLRSSPGQFLALPGWPSTLRCVGDIGNENSRQPHPDDSNLHRHFLGIHGTATGECERATYPREAIRRALPDQRPQGAVLVSRYV
jgi:hypothetical protein